LTRGFKVGALGNSLIFSEMNEILKQQKAIIVQLIQAGEEQVAALRDHDLAGLKASINRQGVCSSHLQKLEDHRLELEKKLAASLGRERWSGLGELIELAGSETRLTLKNIVDDISASVARLREVIEVSKIMLQLGINFNYAVLNTVGPDGTRGYGADGSAVKPGVQAAVDHKV
jgi:SMC interacting uncharacterized protein involved in chromosome segregation